MGAHDLPAPEPPTEADLISPRHFLTVTLMTRLIALKTWRETGGRPP